MKTSRAGQRWQAAAVGLAVAFCITEAVAQQTVARLKDVSGNVLVSVESGLAAGAQGQGIVNGSRIITTANSGAVVVFDNGCEVRLKENERLDVDSSKPCALLVAQPIGPVAPVAAVELSLLPLLLPPGAGAGAALLGGGGGPTPVSPN